MGEAYLRTGDLAPASPRKWVALANPEVLASFQPGPKLWREDLR